MSVSVCASGIVSGLGVALTYFERGGFRAKLKLLLKVLPPPSPGWLLKNVRLLKNNGVSIKTINEASKKTIECLDVLETSFCFFIGLIGRTIYLG